MKKINLMKENHQSAAAVKCLLALLICCCMLFSTVDFPAFAGVSEDVASYSDGLESQDEGFIEEIYEEIIEEEEPVPAPQETGDEADLISVEITDSQADADPADENQPAAASQESSQDESAIGREDLSVSFPEEAAQNEDLSPAPFTQETAVDGVDFVISAEQGVILPEESFTIEWVTDEGLESCVNEALKLEAADDNAIIYHNVFQLSGASLNGKAHVRIQRLGFEDWANQIPGASLSVYVLSYHPDEDSAADRITMLESAYSQDQVEFAITGLGEYDVAAVLCLPTSEPAAEPEPETDGASETVPEAEAVPDASNEPDGFADLTPEAEADANNEPAPAADAGAEDAIPVENASETEPAVSASEPEEAVEENQTAASAGDIENIDGSELIEIIEEAGTNNSEDTSVIEIINDTVETGDSEDTSVIGIINDTVETGDSEDTSVIGIINDTVETGDSEDTSVIEIINDTVETGDSEDTSAIEISNDTVETGDSEDTSAIEIINDTVETGDSEDTSAIEIINDTVETGDSEDTSVIEISNDTVETGDSEDTSVIEIINDAVETGDSNGEAADAEEQPADETETGDESTDESAPEEQAEVPASEPENAASFEIVRQPENAVGKVGDSIRFIVEAKGDGLSYQWQKRSGDDSPWTDIESSGNATFAGSLTPELSFTASKCTVTKQFHCLISQGEADDRETLTTQTVAVVSEEEAAANVPEEEPPAQVSQDEPAEAENKNEADDPETPVEGGEEEPDGEPETAEAEPVRDEENQAVEESEPVTGEEEQPAEELVEQEPVEEESAPAELPENRKANFVIEWDDEVPTIGSIAHFKATLENYDTLEYTLQWQYSGDGENWNDVEGATDKDMDVEVTMSNYQYYWRLSVYVIDVLEK